MFEKKPTNGFRLKSLQKVSQAKVKTVKKDIKWQEKTFESSYKSFFFLGILDLSVAHWVSKSAKMSHSL